MEKVVRHVLLSPSRHSRWHPMARQAMEGGDSARVIHVVHDRASHSDEKLTVAQAMNGFKVALSIDMNSSMRWPSVVLTVVAQTIAGIICAASHRWSISFSSSERPVEPVIPYIYGPLSHRGPVDNANVNKINGGRGLSERPTSSPRSCARAGVHSRALDGGQS